MKNCIACNKTLEDGVRFCIECGAKQPGETAKTTTNTDDTDLAIAKTIKLLEKVYQEELGKLKDDFLRLKQEAELLPLRHEEDDTNPLERKKQQPVLEMSKRYDNLLSITFEIGHPAWRYDYSFDEFLNSKEVPYRPKSLSINLGGDSPPSPDSSKHFCKLGYTNLESELMSTAHYSGNQFKINDKILNGIDKLFINTSKKISDYMVKFPDEVCDRFFNACNNSCLNRKTPEIEKYYLTNTKKPWVKSEKESRGKNHGMMWMAQFNENLKERRTETKKILDSSQEYINSILNEAEQHCIGVIETIKKYYENQLK